MNKRYLILILGIILNLGIWINLLVPASISSNQSGFIVKYLYPPFNNLISEDNFSYLIRKLANFSEFLLLGLLLSYIYLSFNINKSYLITLIHGLMVAVIDEIIQLFIPGRVQSVASKVSV